MIKYQKTKTLATKDNNNSANCIAPNVIYGCFGGCVNTYCVEAQELMKYSSEIKNKDGVMRYPLSHKTKLIAQFKEIYGLYFNLQTIRYIF